MTFHHGALVGSGLTSFRVAVPANQTAPLRCSGWGRNPFRIPLRSVRRTGVSTCPRTIPYAEIHSAAAEKVRFYGETVESFSWTGFNTPEHKREGHGTQTDGP